MDYTPLLRNDGPHKAFLRGMTDAELDTLMACFAPRGAPLRQKASCC